MENLETENEENSNTLGVTSVLDSGDLDEVQMILGDRRRVRPAGVIRPGIKVPTACTPAQKAKYDTMLAAGASYADIDRELISLAGKNAKRSYLRPSNADHFTVRPDDFRTPSDAQRLLNLYADDDGKLRSFPVWFAKGEIDLCVPHNFRGFGRGGYIKYSSDYDEHGDLICRYAPDSVKNPGRSDYRTRLCPGLDDPESCPDYKAKRCRFGGLYRCNVPGVSGIGEVIIPTNSWYGLGEAVANLRRVRDVFGRIHGLFEGKPFLEVRKVEEEVRHDGKRVRQWIITVVPAVDMMELAAANEPARVMQRANAALHALQGSRSSKPTPKPQSENQESENQESENQESENQQAHEKAVEHLQALCRDLKLQWGKIKNWICFEMQNTLSDVSTDSLREFYKDIKNRNTKDRDEFLSYLSSVSSEPKGNSDTTETDYDPNDDVPF